MGRKKWTIGDAQQYRLRASGVWKLVSGGVSCAVVVVEAAVTMMIIITSCQPPPRDESAEIAAASAFGERSLISLASSAFSNANGRATGR